MESILLSNDFLSSGIDLPYDVKKVLSFIANWDYDLELALWFDDTEVFIIQPEYGYWSLYEAKKLTSDLIAANIVDEYCSVFLSSERNRFHLFLCGEYVTALTFRRYYIQ